MLVKPVDRKSHLNQVVNIIGVNSNPNNRHTCLNVNYLYLPSHQELSFVKKQLYVAKDRQFAK
jgi:hypothetical protein